MLELAWRGEENHDDSNGACWANKDDLNENDDLNLQVQVQAFFTRLSDLEQKLISGIHWHNRSRSEMANELGISLADVSRLLSRAYSQGWHLSNSLNN